MPSDQSVKAALELTVTYDLHCEQIDDPDPDWLAEEMAKLLERFSASARLAEHKLSCELCRNGFTCKRKDELEKLTGNEKGENACKNQD